MNYIIKRLKTVRFKRLFEIIDRCHEKSGKNKLFLFLDIVLCMFLYKSGYADYEFLEMYKLKRKQRKNLVTVGKNDKFVKQLNPRKYRNLIDDKYLFNERFKNYLGRDYMRINNNQYNEFKEFCKNKEYIIVKPIDGTWGNKIEKIKVNYKQLKKIFKRLLRNNQLLIEEVADQHKDMAKLHPESVNTIRVISLRNKYGVVSIIGAIIRMGVNHNIVDNFHSGGIYAPIDMDTGKINGLATNKKEELFSVHPTSKIKLIGYQLPLWDKVLKTTIEAHNMIPELGYIGWDVFVNKKGEIGFIEANQYPGHVLYKQMKTKDGEDILPLFKEALNKK